MSDKSVKAEELKNRYLFNVTKRLPEKQRKDIEEELRTLIEDMMEDRQCNEKSEEQTLIEVLEELGDPVKLAHKYQNTGDYLIGGAYYPLYCQILKIVLWCVGIVLLVNIVVNIFITSFDQGNFISNMSSGVAFGIASIPEALIQAFGWVTLIFFLLEKNQAKVQELGGAWKVEKLAPIPYEKAVIPKSDCICGIVFGVIFIVLLFLTPEFLGAWVKDGAGEMIAVPLFNMSQWSRILPIMVAGFSMGLIDDCVKLIAGCYNYTVMWVNVVCNCVSFALAVFLFKGLPLFNENFLEEISQVTGRTFDGKYDIMVQWNAKIAGSFQAVDIFLLVILCCTLLDMGITVYRTLRYANR